MKYPPSVSITSGSGTMADSSRGRLVVASGLTTELPAGGITGQILATENQNYRSTKLMVRTILGFRNYKMNQVSL